MRVLHGHLMQSRRFGKTASGVSITANVTGISQVFSVSLQNGTTVVRTSTGTVRPPAMYLTRWN